MPAQPYDWWHAAGGGGLTVINCREQGESAGSIGGGGAAFMFPNMLCARPLFVGDNGLQLSSLMLNLSTNLAPGSARLGLYECLPPAAHNMYPQGLIEDFGEVVLTGSRRPTLNVSRTLTAGFYYLASVFSSYPGSYSQSNLGGGGLPLGYNPSNGIAFVAFAVRHDYGPLPSTFPALAPAGFGMSGPTVPTAASPAFYCETIDALGRIVSVTFNVGTPAGTAVVTTDNGTTVTVQYGTNTLGSVAAAALAGSANLASCVLTTADALLPNSGSMSATLLPQGPVQGALTGSNGYTAIIGVNVAP